MFLISILTALAKDPEVPAEARLNTALGVTEGSVGPVLWVIGYIGFGLGEYAERPRIVFPLHAGLMGAGLALTADGWGRFGAASAWKRGTAKGQDPLLLETKFRRRVAIIDFATAGALGALGGAGLIWSPFLEGEAGGKADSVHAATSGGVLLVEGVALAGVGLLHWFAPGAPMAALSLQPMDGQVHPHLELSWSW